MSPLEMFRFTLKLYHEIIIQPQIDIVCIVSFHAFVQSIKCYGIHTIKNYNKATKKRDIGVLFEYCCVIPSSHFPFPTLSLPFAFPHLDILYAEWFVWYSTAQNSIVCKCKYK